MNKRYLLAGCILLLCSGAIHAQQRPQAYTEWTGKAMEFAEQKQYREGAQAFSRAFATNDWKGAAEDRYNAACLWALSGEKDSAFYQLERIATKSNYTDLKQLKKDDDLASLHSDKRWEKLCSIVKANKEKAEASYNKPVVAQLETIFDKDQDNRLKLDKMTQKLAYDAPEIQELWKKITYDDSVNLVQIKAILDKYGWMGPDEIGQNGCMTLFLVIQHSDIKTQQHYLPAMRQAVKDNKADAGSLALLEDRVALGEGRRQIYGSQIHGSPDGKMWISPMEDPDNVDKRRAAVGLEPIADYVKHWNITWDVEAYKKQLPEIETKEKGTSH